MNNLTDCIKTGILYEDISGKIIIINQFFCDLFKIFLKPSELTGKDSSLIISAISNFLISGSEGFIAWFNNKDTCDPPDDSYELILSDGRVLNCIYVPVRERGILKGHLWQVNNLTEEKKEARYSRIQKELGFSLSSVTSLDEALQLVLNAVISAEDIDGAGIYLVNPLIGTLDLMKSSGISENLSELVKSIEPDDPKYNFILEGKSWYGPCSESIEGHDILIRESYACTGIIPIKNNYQVIGSLNFVSFSAGFSDNLIVMLESIASQIGRAIERITAQNSLIQSQKNFILLFEAIEEFVVIINSCGKIILTNPALRKKLGYSLNELEGIPFLKLFPADREKESAIVVDKILSGLTNKSDLPFYSKNGLEIPVETNIVPGTWDKREAWYTISHDLTEKKAAEEILRKSEARWQFALENAGDGVWDWDLTSNRIYFSDQWKKIFGYDDYESPESQDDWLIKVHNDDLSRMISALEGHIKGKSKLYKCVYRMICKNGAYKWVLDRGRITGRSKSGIPERIIGTTSDISKMKDYENLLTEAFRKEKELNELKLRFVTKTSHEFRTPLSTMIVAVESLEAYYELMTKGERETKIKRIKDNIHFLNGVIEKILNISNLEAGRLKIEPVKVELCRFLDEIIAENRTLPAIFNAIQFIKSQEPVFIYIDRQMIREVVNNLISNACKYSTKSDPVIIKLTSKKRYAVISFSDNGIGIPKEDDEKIFEPFHRGMNVGNIRGTGLGLTLSKEFIKAHGGDITYSSRPEGGTTFFVTIPHKTVTA
jgi:PAS domain S-box-containing protein